MGSLVDVVGVVGEHKRQVVDIVLCQRPPQRKLLHLRAGDDVEESNNAVVDLDVAEDDVLAEYECVHTICLLFSLHCVK